MSWYRYVMLDEWFGKSNRNRCWRSCIREPSDVSKPAWDSYVVFLPVLPVLQECCFHNYSFTIVVGCRSWCNHRGHVCYPVFWFLGCEVCLLKTLLTQLNDDSHLQFFQVKTGSCELHIKFFIKMCKPQFISNSLDVSLSDVLDPSSL